MTTSAVTAADYARIFDEERARVYPHVDAFEQQCGFAIDRAKLEAAARVLACPLKKHPPNWQHGRILYAAARNYCAMAQNGTVTFLDVGTAKGFSALVLQWAMDDAQRYGRVQSVDVIDPHSRERRNTVAEMDEPRALRDLLQPWPESERIEFRHSTGVAWIEQSAERFHIAFIDGKHSGHMVRREGVLLTAHQTTGDLAIFDDVHIPDVSVAVTSLHQDYRLQYFELMPHRHYAIGVRR